MSAATWALDCYRNRHMKRRMSKESSRDFARSSPELPAWPLQRRQLLYDLNRAASQYWHRNLLRDDKALSYLESRGWSDPRALAARYALGYAPGIGDSGVGFVRHVLRRGFPGTEGREDLERALLAAGLARRSLQNGRVRDHFFGRIIFPIAETGRLEHLADPRSRIAGFGGRLIPRNDVPASQDGSGPPKYLNTPDGPTFPKRRLLYGLSWAAPDVVRSGEVVVLEGYLDLIRVREAGILHVAACCGTALTPEHVEAIVQAAGAMRSDPEASRSAQMVRWGRLLEIILCTDEDEAGRRAADRGARTVMDAGYRARVARFDGGKDPDEMLRDAGADGAERFRQVLEQAASPTIAYLDTLGDAASSPWSQSLRGLVATLRNVQRRGGAASEDERLTDSVLLAERFHSGAGIAIGSEHLLDILRRAPRISGTPRDAEVGR